MNTGDKTFFNLPKRSLRIGTECVRIGAYPDAPIDLPLIDEENPCVSRLLRLPQ